ncbi:MAG: vWA domain-containing protein [Bacillota bacterium]|jgi:Ca-activated chloride channel family protein
MALLTPLALLAGLVIPVIIILYMLKKRTRPQIVSSILLWQRLERLNIPALRLSRLLRSLLLALQILTALVLVLALARPVLNFIGGAARTSVVIIDTSMAMAVSEGGETRLEQARDQVRALIRGKAPGDRLALIAMGEEAAVLSGFTADAAALTRALDGAQVNSGRANPDAALALADNMAKAEEGAQVMLFSAGCFGSFARPPEAEFSFIALGSDQVGNLLLEDVVADGERVYVSVYNNGTLPLSAQVEVRDQDDVPVGRRDLDLPPGERKVLVWRNLPNSPWYKAVLHSAQDQVALDNQFYALAQAPAPGRLLLVSPGNLFLERGLLLYPDLSVSRVAPEGYTPGMAELYDIFVFDGFLPEELPAAPILVFDPPHPNPHLPTGPPVLIETLRPLAHPLLAHADFSEVSIGYGKTVVGGSGILESDQGLLASEYQQQGQPLVAFGFAVQAGDLPLRPAFPILLRNILERFAGHRQQPGLLKFGQAVPGGDITLRPLGSAQALAAGTWLEPGIYEFLDRDQEELVVINAPAVTDSLAARRELESTAGTVAGTRGVGKTPLLWPLLLAALILVGLEWGVDNYGT